MVVGGLIILNVKLYMTLTFSSYGSDRDTCGGTCRGTGRRRLTRTPTSRMRTAPIRTTPMMSTPIAATPITNPIHRRGMRLISNSNLGTCDMMYNDFNIGTGTRNLGRCLSNRNCGTGIICGTREGACHIVTSSCSSHTRTARTGRRFGTGCPGHSSFRGT